MMLTFIVLCLLSFGAPVLSQQHAPDDPRGRSAAVRKQFMQQSGHPHGWSGHVVDHVIPLCAGGPDVVENLQWQRADVALQKDRYEKALCQALKKQGLIVVKAEASK
jgi:hypothetical protein